MRSARRRSSTFKCCDTFGAYWQENTAKTIACALVGSRLDYANSILYGVLGVNIHKLQRTQTTIAWDVKLLRSNTGLMDILRISTGCPSGIASALESRHWFTRWGLRRSRSTFHHSSQTTPRSEVYIQLGVTFCTLLMLRQPLVRRH